MLSVYVTTLNSEKPPFRQMDGWELDNGETNDYGETVWRYEVTGTKKRDVRVFLTFAYATEMIEAFQIY